MSLIPRFDQDASIITRCIPGDEAVINGGQDIVMIGKLVKVGPRIWPTIYDGRLVYLINRTPFTAYPQDGVMWLVEALGYPFFLPNSKGNGALFPMAPCRDTWLRPLRFSRGSDQMVLRAGPAKRSGRVPPWAYE